MPLLTQQFRLVRARTAVVKFVIIFVKDISHRHVDPKVDQSDSNDSLMIIFIRHAKSMFLDLLPRKRDSNFVGITILVFVFVLELLIFSMVPVSSKVLAYAFAAPSLAIVVLLLRKLQFHWSTIALFLAMLGFYASYVGYTSFNERNLDASAQVVYIEYIVNQGRIPPDNHCFVCHHPPLYYGMAAGVYSVGQWLAIDSPLRGVQIFSLLGVFGFVLCTAMVLRRFTRSLWHINLGVSLCGFWPYTVILSARIHNDVLATMLIAWTIYFCVCWYQEEKRSSLVLAIVCAVLAVLAKMNGLQVAFILLATVGFRAAHKPRPYIFLKRVAPLIGVMVIGLSGFILSRGESDPYIEPNNAKLGDVQNEGSIDAGQRLFGSAFRIGKRSWMANEPFNYLYFDVENFLQEPFILARKAGSGRQYFLNHWLKSSLFSTHNEHPDAETSYRMNHRIAQVENFLLLCLVAYVLCFLVRAKKVDFRRQFVLSVASILFLISAAAFRIVVPHAHHADFRHAFAVLMPFTIAYVLATQHYRRRTSILEYLGYGLALCFVAGSVLFFAPKYRLIKRFSPTLWIEKNETQMARRVKAGTIWNAGNHVVLESTDALVLKMKKPSTINRLEVSLDHNDKYRITVLSEQENRSFVVGPHPSSKWGMADYDQSIDPPMEQVYAITVHPLMGDRAYSVGHVIVHRPLK